MTKTLKRKWVTALRSGKYKQAAGRLHRFEKDEHSYCCLGVLGRISGLSNQQLDNQKHTFKPAGSLLSEKNCVKFGLGRMGPLATLNDNGKSFEEIATLIEQGDILK